MIIIICPHRQRISQAGGLGLWLRGRLSEAQTSRPWRHQETQPWLFHSYRHRRGPRPAWGGDSEPGGGAAAQISAQSGLPHPVWGRGPWALGGEDPGPGHRHRRRQPHPRAGRGHTRVFSHMWRQTDTDDKVSTKTSFFRFSNIQQVNKYVLCVRRMSDFLQIEY